MALGVASVEDPLKKANTSTTKRRSHCPVSKLRWKIWTGMKGTVRSLESAGKPGKGKAQGSSLAARVAAATQQRQKLEAILQQDRENLIMEQSQHAGAPHAELRESQLQDTHGTWEASRLRVRVTSLAAENDALRLHVRQLLQEISSQQASSEAQHSVASKKSQLVESEAAGRVAELEEQMDRQRRALSELAVAAEDLASENVGLSTELVQLRTDKQTNSKALTELQSRTQTLQELYMRDLDAAARSPGTPTVREVQQQQALAALATPTLLAVSQPDQEPVGVGQWSLGPSGLGHSTQPSPGASNHNLVYQEREALQHSCSQLQAQVSKLEGRLSQVQIEKDEVSQQCAAERRRAVAAESQGQQRLVGALRRLDYLAAQHKEAEAVLQQRDRYITRLEGRLLANRRAAAANRSSNARHAASGQQQSGAMQCSPPEHEANGAADLEQPDDSQQPGSVHFYRRDPSLQNLQSGPAEDAMQGNGHPPGLQAGFSPSPAAGTIFRSAHISSLRPAAANMVAPAHHQPAAAHAERHEDLMLPSAGIADARSQDKANLEQPQQPTRLMQYGSIGAAADVHEPQGSTADMSGDMGLNGPSQQASQTCASAAQQSPILAGRTEASPLHGSLTNSSSTPQMVHDLGDLHALAASRAQNATAHGQAISASTPKDCKGSQSGSGGRWGLVSPGSVGAGISWAGTPIRAQPSIRDSNASADGPQSSGSSRSLSIDDLERRIEALNSTLQLHVGQRAPLAGLQSPATPTGPLQPVDAPA
ncbi:hypothetical protein WJX74_002989 [Apatococcus lobatus]|uniref:Uncharacterized protein n=1 Tax=Apatococcus lobatus TaxID=904363 RepID=A0AAW1RJ96_9CHLO